MLTVQKEPLHFFYHPSWFKEIELQFLHCKMFRKSSSNDSSGILSGCSTLLLFSFCIGLTFWFCRDFPFVVCVRVIVILFILSVVVTQDLLTCQEVHYCNVLVDTIIVTVRCSLYVLQFFLRFPFEVIQYIILWIICHPPKFCQVTQDFILVSHVSLYLPLSLLFALPVVLPYLSSSSCRLHTISRRYCVPCATVASEYLMW
jgi:hypothetical protein